MADRAEKVVYVELGEFAERVEQRVKDGRYESVSEVVQAGLEALDREDAAFDAILREKVAEALADPRPDITLEEFDRHFEERRRRRLAEGA